MKPAFALDFRDNAVSLLHRSGSGWHQVGSVPLDEPDLPSAIGYLRSTALGLSPQGLATKLVIPNDQILYLPVVAPGPDTATRRSQIAAALEGRTPYPVEDLVFDWSGKGPEVQVAVIARETLAEAEAFAAEHRFNPMSFVAVPEDGTFRGEPWFGPTEMSARLLAPGEKLEKDSQPVALRSRKIVAEPAAQPVAEALPEPQAEVAAEVAPEPLPEAAIASAPVAGPVAEPDTRAAEPVAETVRAGTPEPEAPAPAIDETPDAAEDIAFHIAAAEEPAPEPGTVNAGFDAPAFEPAYAPPPRMEPAAPPPEAPIPAAPVMEPEDLLRADPEMQAEPAAVAASVPLTARSAARLPDEAPMALDVTEEDPLAEDTPSFVPASPEAAAKPVSVVDPAISDEVPPMPAWTPAMAFASRRSSEAAAKGKPLPPAPAGKPGLRAPVERPAGAKPLSAPPRPAAVAERPSVKDPRTARGIGALMGSDKDGKKRKTVAAPPPMAKPAAVQPAKPASPSPQAARQSSIGLGARPAPQRGKPKYLGLILTVILLIFLAAVAAWSTLLASWDGETSGVETATASDPAAPDTGSETPAPEDEMLADMQDPADYADDGAVEPAATAPTEAAAPAEAAPDTAVATEAATAGTPSDDAQDEIFLATMDAPPDAPDPLALPQTTAQGDSLPDTQAAPPPFGTVYQFDANGLIIPTKDGIVTPDGVRLVAGKPAREPPARPAELTAAAAAAAAPVAADPATEAAPAADAPFPSDPALAGARPKLRPEGLATPASASPDDDASLAPAADSRFASLRPRARPEAVVAAGEAARLASAGASLAENAVANPADAAISPLAVAISRKPAARPQDMSRAVEAAVAAATREPPPQPDPEPQPEPAAKPTKAASKTAPPPDDQLADDEPEHTGAAPSIPTKASVAKQATYKNAINLSKLNLIGVYGTQSNRYALIRQENGRYKKVKVGDRIDGGKVAAITANELRYQKGSRMITLSLPTG